MNKCIYMLCPTDNLESVIRDKFDGGHYFITSLGNAMPLDNVVKGYISRLIKKERINEITFVLSEDNQIVLDALFKQNYSEVRSLGEAYKGLVDYKAQAQYSWPTHHQHPMILSCHLNKKIRELRSSLEHLVPNQIEINGKLFSKSYNSFRPIYPDLICSNQNILN